MSDLSEQMAIAAAHHRAGRFAQAGEGYAQVLKQDPKNHVALHLLGLLEVARRNWEDALGHISKAVGVKPDEAAYHNSMGICCQALGKGTEALACYDRAIRLDPKLADAHSNRSSVLRATGRVKEAAAGAREAVRLNPNVASAWNNLGNAHLLLNDYEAAAEDYANALRITPTHFDAHNNRGVVLRKLRRHAEAVEHQWAAVRLRPKSANAHYNLGLALMQTGQTAEARASFDTARRLDPENTLMLFGIACALEIPGNEAEAAELFAEVLRRDPTSLEAKYHLAAMNRGSPPPMTPPSYVRALFDEYAATFDQHLTQELGYQVPKLLWNEVAAIGLPAGAVVMDIGCGTGLSAAFLRPASGRLIGVDLSPVMIEQAKRRGVFDELHVADLTDALADRPASLDLIFAADVLLYLGDLRPTFAAAAKALRPAGLFAFSIETGDEADYTLRPTRRFAHAPGYPGNVGQEFGMKEVANQPATLRMELDIPVAGRLIVQRKID